VDEQVFHLARPEESGSFFKKRTKKLLELKRALRGKAEAKAAKAFWFFFQKRTAFYLTGLDEFSVWAALDEA
jgi:hypothetical protein